MEPVDFDQAYCEIILCIELGGAGRRSCIVSLVSNTRVHLFNAESINDYHKRLTLGLTIGVRSSGGRGRVGEAML